MLFGARAQALEILDEGGFTFEDYIVTMKQLELINRLTRGHAFTIAAIKRVAKQHPGRALRILDVGFGHGDTLRAIARWAKRENVEVELTGIDLNPWAKRLAEQVTPINLRIRYLRGNAFDLAQQEQEYDIILNAFFMHHLTDEGVVEIIEWMSREARLAWFINDLHRHPLSYYFIKAVTRVFGFHPIIRNDAPLSVARGFRSDEWKELLRRAGVPLDRVRMSWHWSFRYGILCDWGQGG